MDALQCFTCLNDHLPAWITRTTELAAHASKKHAEFSEEFKILAQSQPQDHQEHRRKGSSTHSIRPATQRRAERNASGAASLASGDASCRSSRPRLPLVICYDSHIQTQLEQTVRDVGVARNNLRKVRMSQVMRKSITLEMYANIPRDPRRGAHRSAMDGIRITRPIAITETEQKEKPSALDFVDKQLELAQSLSEHAAHRFLRCGDCRKELDDVAAKFQCVAEVAKNEVERLRSEQPPEDENLVQQQIERSLKMPESLHDEKPPEPGSTSAIEVDDADTESSISVDLRAFRSTRYRT